jgi:hypothetical protein
MNNTVEAIPYWIAGDGLYSVIYALPEVIYLLYYWLISLCFPITALSVRVK